MGFLKKISLWKSLVIPPGVTQIRYPGMHLGISLDVAIGLPLKSSREFLFERISTRYSYRNLSIASVISHVIS